MSKMYYLNNTGTKWVYRPNTEYFFIVHDATRSKILIRRKAIYFEQFGNFASIHYSYKGKKYSSVTFSTDIKDVGWQALKTEDVLYPLLNSIIKKAL